MVELVSYWKITCSPQVVVEVGALSAEQIRWWKELYFNGLGEFFYVNHIDAATPDNFMEIRCEAAGETAWEMPGRRPGKRLWERPGRQPGVRCRPNPHPLHPAFWCPLAAARTPW